MRHRFFHSIYAGILCLAFVSHAAAVTVSYTETEFRCDPSSNGSCHFLLYKTACQEGAAINGRPSLVCINSYLQDFSVDVGQTRKIQNLPSGFKQCPVKSGTRPVFPMCAQ